MILSAVNTYTGAVTLGRTLRTTAAVRQAGSLGADRAATALTLNGRHAGAPQQRRDQFSIPVGHTVNGNATIVADVASGITGYVTGITPWGTTPGLTHKLGTLAIGADTLSVSTDGSSISTGVGLTFGATTLTGASGAATPSTWAAACSSRWARCRPHAAASQSGQRPTDPGHHRRRQHLRQQLSPAARCC